MERESAAIEWRRRPPASVSEPVIQCLPYLELKLEHPELEPSGYGDRFFPDVVPYELDDRLRVFYWRPAAVATASDPADWTLACATTHGLMGVAEGPAAGPPLLTEGARGTIVVVDGTIGGDATTCSVQSYAGPTVRVERRSDAEVELAVSGTDYRIGRGERRRIRLPEQRVVPVDTDGGETTVTPELVVRYPGRRELHHPARGATYRLFPSFGLDLSTVPNPLATPAVTEHVDDAALAADLGVDLSQRPYPERVLWQAFAHTAFDARADTTPELTQLSSGHIVLRGGARTD